MSSCHPSGRSAATPPVEVHAQSGRLLEEGQDQFTFAKPVDHHRRGAEVHAVRGHPDEVRGDAVELAHHHADPHCALGHLDPEELLHGHRVRELVDHRREVVHARHVRGTLDVTQLFGGLLHAGVQVTNDGLGAKDELPVELKHQTKHAVGRRVRRTHVDDHGLVVASIEVHRVGVDVETLDPKNRTDLASELVGAGVAAAL
jgi:hypothetical protein